MAKKKKKGRVSPMRRLIENTEAEILGLPPPHTPKVYYTRHVPTTHMGLWRGTSSDELRIWYIRLAGDDAIRNIPEPLRIQGEIAMRVLAALESTTLDILPGTVAGLAALGEVRLRYAVGLLLDAGVNRDIFLLTKKARELTFHELAQRVYQGLRAYDAQRDVSFHRRDPMLPPDFFDPELEPDRPTPKAKTVRLLNKRQDYIVRTRSSHVGNNKTAAGRKRRERWWFGHVGERNAELKCGCVVRISLPTKDGRFHIHATALLCTWHAKRVGKLAKVHHVSELKEKCLRPRQPTRDDRAHRRPRPFSFRR